MNALARTSFAIALLAIPATARADDDAIVTDPRMQPPPAPPPTTTAPVQQQPQAQAPKRTTAGVDLAVVIPLGDYADGSDFGFGGLFRVEYAAAPQVDVTLRLGYIWNKTDQDGLSMGMIPVLLGGAFKLGGGTFAYAEIGISQLRLSVDIMGFTATDATTYLSAGGGLGYAADKVKARVGLWMPGRPKDSNDGSHTTLYGILGTVGYDFSAF